MSRSSPQIKSALKPPKQRTLPIMVSISPPLSKRVQFEIDSDQLIINTTKTYFDLSLNLSEVNTSSYQKCI